jgi:cytochrome P450
MPHAPSLSGLPILGVLPELRRDRLALLLRAARSGHALVRLPLPGRLVYVASSVEAAAAVLRTDAAKYRKFFALSELSRPMLGGGLLTAEGAAHRRQRRIVAPGLSKKEIAAYADIMVRHAIRTEDAWHDGASIDVLAEMSRLTVGIASETMFGSDTSSHAAAIGEAVETTLDYIARGLASLVRLPASWPLPRHIRMRRAVAVLDGIIEPLLRARREAPASSVDILGMLLAARDADTGEALGDTEIRDEVATLLVAGFETTASALTWTFYLLGRHPEVAARLHDEVCGVLGGRPPTVADLARMPFVLQVFKEAMRLYPPGYMVGRETLEPAELAGVALPRGATVLVNIYGLHRDPTVFPEPERFDPDRFAPEREARLPRGAYLPFSDGPRVCIGYHFALMEAHLLLAHLAAQVTLEATDTDAVRPLPRVTMRPGRPVIMRVRRVER